jgi:deoxyadenosine/deoxycytidine kinase
VSEPDLVIWLQASPATLLRRIQRRAIPMERDIDEAYLQRLCDAYVEHFRGYRGAPVIAFDTEQFNPVASDADFNSLLDRLAAAPRPGTRTPAER